ASAIPAVAEEIDGPIMQMVSQKAREGRMHVLSGHLVREEGRLFNRAVLFGRDGAIVGSYSKMHPVGGEADAGVTPGVYPGSFELDVGRIGVSICFDI